MSCHCAKQASTPRPPLATLLHGVLCAQVLIRWAIQRGTMVLPKSANADRIAANFDVLDWQLKEEDQQALSSLPHRVSLFALGV